MVEKIGLAQKTFFRIHLGHTSVRNAWTLFRLLFSLRLMRFIGRISAILRVIFQWSHFLVQTSDFFFEICGHFLVQISEFFSRVAFTFSRSFSDCKLYFGPPKKTWFWQSVWLQRSMKNVSRKRFSRIFVWQL